MKKLTLLISLTLIAAASFGQTKIDGTFQGHDPYNWYSYKFYSDSLYTISCSGCKGGGESRGVYKIKDDVLTLYYMSSDTIKNYPTEKISCPPSQNNYFNKAEFRYKKGDTEVYKIKECNSQKIALTQGKNNFEYWRKEN